MNWKGVLIARMMITRLMAAGLDTTLVARRAAALLLVVLFLGVPNRVGAQIDSLTAGDSVASDTAAADAVQLDAAEQLIPDTAAATALLETVVPASPETVDVRPLPPSAPIFMGGREVFRARVAHDGITPLERAALIQRRINRAIADKQVPADSVRLVSSVDGVEVRLGPHYLWLVTRGDAELTDTRELAAWLAQLEANVRDAVVRERTGRTPIRLMISAAIAVGLTILAWALLRLLMMASQRWRDWLRHTVGKRIPAIRVRGFEILSRGQISGIVAMALGRLDVVAAVLLLYAYLTAVFSLFPWTQGWSWQLVQFATTQFFELARALLSGLPGLLTIALIVFVFRWLMGLSDRFFDAISEGSVAMSAFHPELARPSKRLIRILLWISAFMFAYPFIPGSQTQAFQGISILLGIMVSLGSTGIVGNILAGLVLTYSRSFRVGDRIRVGEEIGDVVSLGFFATKLRTPYNEEITLPNGIVANGAILNYSRLAKGDGLALNTEVTIGYDVEWRKVHELLIEAAGRVEEIEEEPPPTVFQRALDDHYVRYQLVARTKNSHEQMRLYSELLGEVQDAFSRAGIEILSPSYQAIRDANAAVLPKEPKGPRPEPGGFRLGSKP